jgi:hypothetical protein
MTFKFVGALRGITTAQPHVMVALQIGVAIGLVIGIARKLIKSNRSYQQFAAGSIPGRITDFLVDAVIIPTPYASSFGGFVEIPTVLWWTAGGVLSALYNGWVQGRAASRLPAGGAALPSDMSTTSLFGGGLIAGDSLAALTVGLYGLLRTLF